ncbi:unnamed protein product, partial [Rotaria sordida]
MGAKEGKILGPTLGYSQEPLLPLINACEPLSSIIPDISKHASSALESTPSNPADGLTRDESAAIRLFTMKWADENKSLHTILNDTLKTADRENLKPWHKYLKLFLTALAKIPCLPSDTIWHGVRGNISGEYPSNKSVIWWSFVSCTNDITVLSNPAYLGDTGERTLFSIEVINARSISAHSYPGTDLEILLLPGTYVVVKSIFSPSLGLNIHHLVQEKPKEVLLEPPFEDACLYPKHGLNVKLSNCSSPCSCHVQTNKTDNLVPAEFFPNTTKGSVHIKNLQPYTLYLFDINCSEVMATKTYATRTDVYRPSSPLNIELTLNGQRLRLKWKPPAFPQGPIDEYQVIVDGVQVKPPMKNTELSYEMNKDYVAGITHTISVKACNIDTQNRTLCSDPKDTEISYFRNKTSTSSNIAPMESISIKQISFMIILLMKIL